MDFYSVDFIWTIVKWAYVFAAGIYVIFSLVVMAQLKSMTSTLNGALDLPLKVIGWVHMLVALGVFMAAIVLL